MVVELETYLYSEVKLQMEKRLNISLVGSECDRVNHHKRNKLHAILNEAVSPLLLLFLHASSEICPETANKKRTETPCESSVRKNLGPKLQLSTWVFTHYKMLYCPGCKKQSIVL